MCTRGGLCQQSLRVVCVLVQGGAELPVKSQPQSVAHMVYGGFACKRWITCCITCAQVTLSGTSYEATAALFTMSLRHPAVKGCLAQYPFW